MNFPEHYILTYYSEAARGRLALKILGVQDQKFSGFCPILSVLGKFGKSWALIYAQTPQVAAPVITT